MVSTAYLDFVAVLAQHGWIVPAFSMPPDAESVNAMRESISGQIESLEDSNHVLREQVTERQRTELALVESLDVGKPIADTAGGDVPSAARTIRWSGEERSRRK